MSPTFEDCQCARCGSSVYRVDCDCGTGFTGHDCGEDCCSCVDPFENVVCDTCHGESGWYECLSSPEWCEAHPRPGKEHIERGEVEWFSIGGEP